MDFENLSEHKYNESPIDVIDEHARVWGTRLSPKIYFSSTYSGEFKVDWNAFLPDNCFEKIQVQFNGEGNWYELGKNPPFSVPSDLNIEELEFFVIRQVLTVEKAYLFDGRRRPFLDWITISDTYTPLSCEPNMLICLSQDANDNLAIYY